MESDQGKLFIGGISWETDEDMLKDYFSSYGDVVQTAVMRDKTTGRPRGFGFVVFSDPSVLDSVLREKHTIDGRLIEAKRALSREEQQTNARSGYSNPGRGSGGGEIKTKKIFVGGLPPTLTEDEFRQYFETYGNVTDVVIMYDQATQRPRGFGFISFDSEEAVDRVLHKSFHDMSGKKVEVKRALPKDANPYGSGRTVGGGGGGSGGGYPGYGSHGSANSYDSRMESSRYMQPPNAAGGFGPYGSSGYGGPGYGYGPSNNGMGYGGYGAYGGANAGFGSGAGFGNPNIHGSMYAGGPQGGSRSSWNSQPPSGYGAMGYGSAASWGAGAGNGGPMSGPSGQSPSGATGYGAQGYGYGGYAGADGSYGGVAGYGAPGGRYGGAPNGGSGVEMLGNSGGYSGGGYGNADGNQGYGSAGWRSDLSQASGNYGAPTNGPHSGYNNAYGGGQARQAQQQ
ncbi:hypothetical protein MLD38_039541 [Melastoma candidum]|uniref:Uncharacterized protein n=1 Tax=Melastoma candidum TaxID=119954 RepID=A0ACB9L3A1_9MYRT|nr:hypothetical protein MLD38_039541 [Melastoma candidum]